MGARDQQTSTYLLIGIIMSRKANIFSFTRTLTSKREDLARARKDVAKLADHSDAFKPAYAIANAIAGFAATLGFDKYVCATPSVYSWSVGDELNLDVRFEGNVDSLKDGPVPAVCEFIMGFGLESKYTIDYAEEHGASRTFKFTGKIGGVDVNVRFEANINDGSDACRKVQVGTEIKEVAKYEIVCA
jgi:hypothetical protein